MAWNEEVKVDQMEKEKVDSCGDELSSLRQRHGSTAHGRRGHTAVTVEIIECLREVALEHPVR